MPDDSDLQAKLDEIKRAYQAELPSKAAELKRVWNELQADRCGADKLQELHRLAHSLAGSGATFGFEAVSRNARTLENRLKDWMNDATADTNATRATVSALLDALVEVLTETGQHRNSSQLQRAGDEPEATNENIRPLLVVGSRCAEVNDLCEQLGFYGYQVQLVPADSDLVELRRAAAPVGLVVAQDTDPALLERIRRLGAEGAPEEAIPIVVVAERFDLEARLAAVRAGCGAYFTWPVDAGVLAGRLDALSERQIIEPYRVLIVEDDHVVAEHYAAVLDEAGLSTRVVNQPMDAMRSLAEFNPELILMDLYMPGCSGVELAGVIRQEDAYVGVPIVYLSNETDLSKQIDALRHGGDEFLTKPIESHLLVAAVRCRVQRSRVLGSFLRRDSLTGLLNHTSTKEALATEVERARRAGKPFTFAMIDIDRFKSVNDTHGHPVGDRVIKSLARLLQQRLRKTDVVGRFGGEEFALILPDTPLENALPVLQELKASFENIRQSIGEAEFSVTFSCGLAAYPAHQSADEILFRADEALYKAKHQGRNRVIAAQ